MHHVSELNIFLRRYHKYLQEWATCSVLNQAVLCVTYVMYMSCKADTISLAIFPGGPGLAPVLECLHSGFIGAKDDGGGGDNWICEMQSSSHSLATNKWALFFMGQVHALPVTQPTVSALKGQRIYNWNWQ